MCCFSRFSSACSWAFVSIESVFESAFVRVNALLCGLVGVRAFYQQVLVGILCVVKRLFVLCVALSVGFGVGLL